MSDLELKEGLLDGGQIEKKRKDFLLRVRGTFNTNVLVISIRKYFHV